MNKYNILDGIRRINECLKETKIKKENVSKVNQKEMLVP